MDNDLLTRLDALEKKIDAVHVSAEKTRKMILWTVIIATVITVLPLIGMAFVLPSVISGYASALGV